MHGFRMFHREGEDRNTIIRKILSLTECCVYKDFSVTYDRCEYALLKPYVLRTKDKRVAGQLNQKNAMFLEALNSSPLEDDPNEL